MRLLKRCLLLSIVGSISVVLAGCYGAPIRDKDGNEAKPQGDKKSSLDLPERKAPPIFDLKLVGGTKSIEKASADK